MTYFSFLSPSIERAFPLRRAGRTYYEEKYKERLLHNLSERAKELGFQLTTSEPVTVLVS